jgi:hypothetical protein
MLLVLGLAATWILVGSREPRGEEASGAPGAPSEGETTPPPTVTNVPRPNRVESQGPAPWPGAAGEERRAGVIESPWGSGPAQLGRDRPQEGNPEAPMSLTTGPGGTLVVLDQVNDRLVRIRPDGTRETIPSPLQAPQDVALGSHGELVVLDRLADRSIALLSPDGRVVGQLPVEGDKVPEGGSVTGVFTDRGGVYVEVEHGALVKVGDEAGHPSEGAREELPGRPARDGSSFLSAALLDGPAGSVLVQAIGRESGLQRFARDLRLGEPVASIVLLDSDLDGVVYLGLALPGGPDDPGRVALVALDGKDGQPLGRRDVPASSGPEETFREFAVQDRGGVVQSRRDEGGVTLDTWTVRGH